MRFIRLDLERYGPFTDCSIPFREDARLHLVYGRNEAGKSTALSAITDLLFGFPQRASQDFLHRLRDLRVGARIVDRSGRTLEFRRRRGNLRTLIDAAEAPLQDDLLKPYLGQMTREVFTRAFGLSTQELREGGRDMLKEKGDIGSALFAAASGLHGPSRLKRSLETEAERIFDIKKAGHRSFYQALDRYQAARKAEGELRLRAADWKELNERIEGFASRQAEIDAERKEMAAEAARLGRRKRLAPLMLLVDQATAELTRLDIAAPPPGFAERLRTALATEAAALRQHEDCGKALDALERERDGLVVDEALLQRANEIAALFAESGQYAKAKLDLPGVDREAQGLRREVDNLARRLGLAEAAELEQRLPPDADLALLGGLRKEGHALATETEGLRANLARERQACAALEREQAGGGPVAIDPEPLRARLAEIDPVLRRLQQRGEIERQIRLEERALAEATARLDPKVPSLDALAQVALPAAETIARFRKEFEAAGRTLERAHEEAEAAERSCSEIEAALDRLAAGRAVPSAEVIAAGRGKRNADWAQLRASLFGAELAPEERAKRAASFELNLAEADRLADEALADAKRVAQHAVQMKALEVERRRHAKARDALSVAEARAAKLAADWRVCWAPSGLVPLPPAEMASWTLALGGLLERRLRLEERRDALRALVAEERAIATPFREIAKGAGLETLEAEEALQTAQRLEMRLRRLSESWEAARGLGAKIAASRERAEQYQAMLDDASTRSRAWSERWRKALPKLGLSPDANLDEAEAVLVAWSEVPEGMRTLAREERRIAGMRRDNADFEQKAKALFDDVAPDLMGAPPQIAAHSLNERSTAAARAAALRKDCGSRLAAATDRHKLAATALAETRQALSALASEVGVGAEEDLVVLLSRLDRRAEIEAVSRRRREEMLRAADGLDEEAVRAELAGFDATLADQRLNELAEEDKHLLQRSQEAYASRQEAAKVRTELEAGIGAELAAQMRRNAESEMTQEARRWAVLKLASLLVGTAIERHRQAAQNPLMSRAADLFAGLTAGAFAGLGSRADDDDIPVLVGQRADGNYVGIDGMSEGTRDQLYLALRLAYVESYAASSEPPPFIADDIFVTFDDERSERGLKALAAIGREVQCILFTHHRRTAEIAAEHLGAEVDIIEL